MACAAGRACGGGAEPRLTGELSASFWQRLTTHTLVLGRCGLLWWTNKSGSRVSPRGDRLRRRRGGGVASRVVRVRQPQPQKRFRTLTPHIRHTHTHTHQRRDQRGDYFGGIGVRFHVRKQTRRHGCTPCVMVDVLGSVGACTMCRSRVSRTRRVRPVSKGTCVHVPNVCACACACVFGLAGQVRATLTGGPFFGADMAHDRKAGRACGTLTLTGKCGRHSWPSRGHTRV